MRHAIIFSVAAALFAAGCGGDEGPAVHPVTGKLTIGGKAVDGIQITFEPIGEGEAASGNTQPDGTYTLFTGVQGRVGAAAGKYKVVLVDPGGDDYMKEGATPKSEEDASSSGRIPADYTPKEVEVKAGENKIDIEV